MFVVRTGRVRISRKVRGGKKTFAVLGPGEFFGEMAIINNKPRSASAEAMEDVQLLELDADFSGPTYGAGLTLQGGARVNDWRELTAIVVADWNRTQTNLSFANEALIAETKPIATVFSARVGLHGTLGSSHCAAVWTGAMHQPIQQEVAGSVADTELQFIVMQSPAQPWNALLGGLFEFGEKGYVLLEGGFGKRKSILAAAVYRF